MENFVTVAIFNYSHEITILKHRLEQEGIPYFFENENIVSIDPFSSIAYGGIKLKVHSNDLLATKEIVEELSNNDNFKIV
jgi:hypothetical protein